MERLLKNLEERLETLEHQKNLLEENFDANPHADRKERFAELKEVVTKMDRLRIVRDHFKKSRTFLCPHYSRVVFCPADFRSCGTNCLVNKAKLVTGVTKELQPGGSMIYIGFVDGLYEVKTQL